MRALTQMGWALWCAWSSLAATSGMPSFASAFAADASSSASAQSAAAPAAPAAPAAARAPEALTVDEVIARHIAARGGLDKIAAIQTLMVTGRLYTGNDAGQPITVRLRRPNQIRQDFIVQMRNGTRAYDGAVGWERMPAASASASGTATGAGTASVELLTGTALKDIQDEAENGIDGPLVGYRDKGHRVTLEGFDTFDGRRCLVLAIRLRTGRAMKQFLDADTFLEVGERLTRSMNGKEIEIEETVGDHRPVGGVLFPHLYISGTAASPRSMRLRVEKIVANPASPPIDETIFRNPAAARP